MGISKQLLQYGKNNLHYFFHQAKENMTKPTILINADSDP